MKRLLLLLISCLFLLPSMMAVGHSGMYQYSVSLTGFVSKETPYECGLDNPRRSHTAWLIAILDGDKTYKRVVKPLEVKIPFKTDDTYTNPVLFADYSDPDVCAVGEEYYLTASSFNCFPGLPVLHSRDLVHWTQIGAALTDYPGAGWEGPEHDFRTRVQHGNGAWAPV